MVFDGSANGGVTSRAGLLGQGASFDGDSDAYIQMGVHPQLDLAPDTTLSMEAWVRIEDTNWPTHVVHNEGACRGWRMYTPGDGLMHARAGSSTDCTDSSYVLTVGEAPPDEEWVHVNMVISISSSMTVCLDTRRFVGDELVKSDTCDSQTFIQGELSAGTPLLIGANYDFSQIMLGEIDELRIHSGERSSDWIDAQVRAAVGQFTVFEAAESL